MGERRPDQAFGHAFGAVQRDGVPVRSTIGPAGSPGADYWRGDPVAVTVGPAPGSKPFQQAEHPDLDCAYRGQDGEEYPESAGQVCPGYAADIDPQ